MHAPIPATGKLFYRIRRRKRWREFLAFLKSLRQRWPADRLYVVLDNFSPHKHPMVREWATANDVTLVFLPTYGSWLNWIESEFAAPRRVLPHQPQHQHPDGPHGRRPGPAAWASTAQHAVL
jgi:hypothetical protein